VIWRFTGSRNRCLRPQSGAHNEPSQSPFFLLAPYNRGGVHRAIFGGAHEMTSSVLGVAVTAASLVVMPLLGAGHKQRLGKRLHSGATTGEGMQNYLCAAQSRGRAARAGRDGSVWVGLA